MKIIIKKLKKRKDVMLDIELSNRLSQFVEKQDVVKILDKIYKIIDDIKNM